MKKLFFSIIFIHCSFSFINAQTGWVQQNSGTNYKLNSVFFVDANTGFISADSNEHARILKSTNGGTTWFSLNIAVVTGPSMRTIYFVDNNTGYAGGADAPSAVIIKTTNGGANWTQLFPPSGIYGIHSLYFLNALTGFEVGSAYASAGFIYKTINGGLNWQYSGGAGNILYSIYFVDFYTGYACGTPGTIMKTTDTGLSWVTQTSNTSAILRSIYSTGWTTGTDSRVYKTTNGGTTWTMFYNQSLCGLYSVYFTNEQTGWVCGCEGAINGTTNNGLNWTLQSFASTTYLYSIKFINSATGWAVGAGGTILKTTTGGLTFIQPISTEIPKKFSLSQNYPNPFNPTTKIQFDIPVNSFAKLIVYDALGREVDVLVSGKLQPGTYETNWDANNFPSGVYYYKLIAGNFNETKKLVVLK